MFTRSLSPLIHQPFIKNSEDTQHRTAQNKGQHPERTDKLLKRPLEEASKSEPLTDSKKFSPVSTQLALQSYSSSRSEAAEIQVMTTDGDVVTIAFNQSTENSRGSFQAQQGDTQISYFQESNAYQAGLSINIEGEIDEEEQESLNQLMEKMSQVSEKFFDGNVNAAFKHAQNIGYDTEQIAGFSMDLKIEESVQAVAAYQQTLVPDQNINTDLLKQAGDFLAQTKAFLEDSLAGLDALAEPKQSFTDMFSAISDLQNDAPNQLARDEDGLLFQQVIDNISNDLLNLEKLVGR